MTSSPRPLLFLTGFLGSGKTTLLRTLLDRLAGKGMRADVILNDFANADLEAETLEEKAASVAPIAASCACCESLDELVSLCRTAGEGRGDVLLIELNGTADPVPVLEAFAVMEEALPFSPRLQVSVVDARHWGQRGEFGPLEHRQLETASLWIPSHVDVVAPERLEEVDAGVRDLFPHAHRVSAEELVDGIVGERHAPAWEPGQPGPEADGANNPSEPPSSIRDEVHRLSHRFSAVSLPLPSPVRRASIERLLQSLPDSVLRAKALVKLVEEPGCRWLFQRTGTEDLPEPIPVPGLRQTGSSLICVGPHLEPDVVRERIRLRFGAEAERLG